MANVFYNSYLDGLFPGDLNLISDDIRVGLIDAATYIVNAADQFLSDVPGAAIVGVDQLLTGKAILPTGRFNADGPNWAGLVGAPAIGALLFYKDTGVAGTSPLILYMDDASGLPTAAGLVTVAVTWNVFGIFEVIT